MRVGSKTFAAHSKYSFGIAAFALGSTAGRAPRRVQM